MRPGPPVGLPQPPPLVVRGWGGGGASLPIPEFRAGPDGCAVSCMDGPRALKSRQPRAAPGHRGLLTRRCTQHPPFHPQTLPPDPPWAQPALRAYFTFLLPAKSCCLLSFIF